MEALRHTDLSLPNKRSGKVRDLYDCPLPDGSEGLLIIATDRVSAFDVILPNGIPGKGVLLTQIARYWFAHFEGRSRHHLVTTDVSQIKALGTAEQEALRGRVMLCKRYQVVPIECIARGYLAGSGYQEYQAKGSLCGLALPAGLRLAERLPEALFTPSTKADEGHDENISFAQAADLVGEALMQQLQSETLRLYQAAAERARTCGLILADTKLEFGLDEAGEPVLIDEIFTPDSSRFWDAASHRPGETPKSFDKQPIRDYLETLVSQGQWNKAAPAPALPQTVVDASLERYQTAYRLLSGERATDALG